MILGCVSWLFESVVGGILDSGCRLKTVVDFEFYSSDCTSYPGCLQVVIMFVILHCEDWDSIRIRRGAPSPGESHRQDKAVATVRDERAIVAESRRERVTISRPLMELLDSHVYWRGSGVGQANTRLCQMQFL
jgi:hypothetical protein